MDRAILILTGSHEDERQVNEKKLIFLIFLNVMEYFSYFFLLDSYFKQAFLADLLMPYDLPDGTPSFKSYVNSKNNRFLNPDMASKNRLQPLIMILGFKIWVDHHKRIKESKNQNSTVHGVKDSW